VLQEHNEGVHRVHHRAVRQQHTLGVTWGGGEGRGRGGGGGGGRQKPVTRGALAAHPGVMLEGGRRVRRGHQRPAGHPPVAGRHGTASKASTKGINCCCCCCYQKKVAPP
jgi:hypothetical protein